MAGRGPKRAPGVPLPWAWLAVVVLVVPSCSAAGAADDGLEKKLRVARAEATEATDLVEDLATRVDALEDDVVAERAERRRALKRFRSRLAALNRALDASLAKLRQRLSSAESSAESSASASASALSEARAVARDLAVLEQRLDYHLKNEGGR